MISNFRTNPTLFAPLLLAASMLSYLCGCSQPKGENNGGEQAQEGDMSGLSQKLSSLNSASAYLAVSELDKFQPGQTMEDILADVKWRGNFPVTADCKGTVVSAIDYELFSDGPHDNGGISTFAVFVDGKFVKFVVPPPAQPEDTELVDNHGTPEIRNKPFKAGDTRFLVRAMQAEGQSIEDLRKAVEAEAVNSPPPPPQQQHTDPGLTAAYLLLRAMGAAPGPGKPASEKDYLRNAALRDQFNGARLRIGMTESDVDSVLEAKPLESGKVDGGDYRIYGSNESFNVDDSLHFSNILVVFRDRKASAIVSVPAGYDWRWNLGQATVDLPAAVHP